MTFYFTSFTGQRPAQREWTRTGLIGPMWGAIPTQSHNLTTQPSHTTRVYIPLFFFRTVVWVLLRPTRTDQWKCCGTGPTGFLLYPRRQKNLNICRCHYKGSTKSSQLFKDPKCCSSQGLNLRPPTQPTGTLPTELTGGSLFFHLIRAIFVIFFFQSLKKEFIR